MYDWVNFFGNYFKKIPLITKQHHFEFRWISDGSVQVREFSDTSEKVFTLYTSASYNGLPEVITPPSLSLRRKWYLHNKIREFCSPETRDLVCPKPGISFALNQTNLTRVLLFSHHHRLLLGIVTQPILEKDLEFVGAAVNLVTTR